MRSVCRKRFINPLITACCLLALALAGAAATAQVTSVTVDVLEVEVGNDMAYQTHFVAVTDVDGNLLTQGYGLVILKRVDGEWRGHRHLQNVILPEPEDDDMGGSE